MKKFPTKFARYYVSDDGVVYREDNKGQLYALKSHPRGGVKNNRYYAVNVSLYDDTGKFQKQIRYYVHRLVAETLIENPEGHNEIDHIDRDKSNNAVSNLKWCSRKENMQHAAKNYEIIDTVTGKKYEGYNSTKWVRDNWTWISKRTSMNIDQWIKNFKGKKKINGIVIERIY
jgi:hypothetical protein